MTQRCRDWLESNESSDREDHQLHIKYILTDIHNHIPCWTSSSDSRRPSHLSPSTLSPSPPCQLFLPPLLHLVCACGLHVACAAWSV